MLADRLQELADAPAWQAETLRLTAFPNPATRLGDARWWETVVGQQPEARLSRPRITGYQEVGPFEGGRLTLGATPPRIDWVFTPAEPGPEDNPAFFAVGILSDALRLFVTAMSRWVTLGPDLQRLAFGATALLPVPDLPSGYRELQRLLPEIPIDAEHSSDFFYQINRPRPSRLGLPHLHVNRLSKWSVAMVQRVLVNVSPAGAQQVLPAHGTALTRVELDINTAPSFPGDLPRERLGDILDELSDLAVEIILRGDQA